MTNGETMFKVAVVVGGVLVACLSGAGVALADDVEGGHCEYYGIVINPQCNTVGNSEGKEDDGVILVPAGPDVAVPLEPLDPVNPGTF